MDERMKEIEERWKYLIENKQQLYKEWFVEDAKYLLQCIKELRARIAELEGN